MIRLLLMGKAKDVFAEFAFLSQLEEATGRIIMRYQPELEPDSQNLKGGTPDAYKGLNRIKAITQAWQDTSRN